MAICLKKLSKRGRSCLHLTFKLLCFFEIIVAIAMASLCLYAVIIVAPQLFSEKAEVEFVFFLILLISVHILVHYIIGFKISSNCFKKAERKSTRNGLFLWIMGSFHVALNVIIISSLSVKISKHIVRSMRRSLEKGIKNYLSDPNWKHEIDKIQITNQCCGIDSYADWHEISWISRSVIDQNSPLVKKIKKSGEGFRVPVVPWSCCKIDFPLECLHDPFQQTRSAHIWEEQFHLVLDSINDDGCLSKLREPIEMVFVGIMVLTLVLTFFQAVLIVVARLLYTSSKNAILLQNPDGISPGWLCGPGDCGFIGTQSLEDIMKGKKRQDGKSTAALKKSKTKDLTKDPKEKKSSNVSKKGKTATASEKSDSSSSGRSDENPVPSDHEEALLLA